jgi:hypothetical protein
MSANGDVVLLHHGTYIEATPRTDSSGSCTALAVNTYFAWFPKDGVGKVLTSTTLRAATGDTPTLNVTQNNAILVIRDGATIRGLTLNFTPNQSGDSSQVAAIRLCDVDQTSGDGARTDGTIGSDVSDVDIASDTINYLSTCATCASGNVAIESKGGANRITIESNTISGGYDFGLLFRDSYALNGGAIIRNNTFAGTKASSGGGAQRDMILEDLGAEPNSDSSNAAQSSIVAIYNNKILRSSYSGTDYAVFLREVAWKVFAWNNVFRSGGIGIWFQDDLCNGKPTSTLDHYHDEQYRIFNNTWYPVGGSGVDGVEWNNFNNANFTNNIFKGYTNPMRLKSGGTEYECPSRGCCVSGSFAGYSCDATTNLCNIAGACASLGICRDDSPRGVTTSNANKNVCSNKVTCQSLASGATPIAETGTIQTDPSLTSDGHLATGSGPVIGGGTNDPLGQGAGLCSVPTWAGSISCATDMDGEPRGVSWDVGADQFGTGGSPTPPQTPVNLRRIDKH